MFVYALGRRNSSLVAAAAAALYWRVPYAIVDFARIPATDEASHYAGVVQMSRIYTGTLRTGAIMILGRWLSVLYGVQANTLVLVQTKGLLN